MLGSEYQKRACKCVAEPDRKGVMRLVCSDEKLDRGGSRKRFAARRPHRARAGVPPRHAPRAQGQPSLMHEQPGEQL